MVTIITKVTEACNSRCAYCDVVAKPHQQTTTMNDAVLEQLYIRVNEYLQADSNKNCQIIWHGGEPLLAGTDFFNSALRFYKQHCATTQQRVTHALQSNLTQMRPEFIPVLKQLGINSIGTSYEPIPHIRGPGLEHRSEVYNKQFMRGTQLLADAGMSWGTIYVVNKKSLTDPLGLFYFMTNLSPNSSVMFNPVLIYGEDTFGLAITPEEYVEFLGTIFPIWWQKREHYRGCKPFQFFVDNIVNGQNSLGCSDSGICHKTHLSLSPDGTFSQCGRACDWSLLTYGSVFDLSFDQVIQHLEREVLRQRDAVLLNGECSGCRFWSICHGGCPLDAWARHKSFLHKTPWCYAKHGFIEKYFEPITGSRYDPNQQAQGNRA